MSGAPRTIVDKIWDAHQIADLGSNTALLHIDRIFLHDRTGGRMLQGVHAAGRRVAQPQLVHGTFDHLLDTEPGRTDQTRYAGGAEFIHLYRQEAKRAGIPLIEIDDARQGIVHVVATELGIALPGSTFVCGDSHTCTIGGIGVLAWGIGVTQGEHVLATQTLRQRRPRVGRVRFDGTPAAGVSAKDMALAMIGRYGAAGGRGCAIEYTGEAVSRLTPAGRMTLCNMAVEFGAWTGIVAPDEAVFDMIARSPARLDDQTWQQAQQGWHELVSDEDARYEFDLSIACATLTPQVTWGTSPEHVVGIDQHVPDPARWTDDGMRASGQRALEYSGLRPGMPLTDVPIEAAFIGSCTNARLDDLREAARVLRGRKVAEGVLAICVPGSSSVKRAAESEGLDQVFRAAGFQWRESGCSLCFFSGGDSFGECKRVVTSTNRNFENRQGPGVRSHLASPATVAASALAGHLADPRPYLT